MLPRRNAEFKAVCEAKLSVEAGRVSASGTAVRTMRDSFWKAMGTDLAAGGEGSFRVLEADVVVWQGDLNYRLVDESDAVAAPPNVFQRAFQAVEPFPDAPQASGARRSPSDSTSSRPSDAPVPSKDDVWKTVVAEIYAKDWPALRKRDQLLAAIRNGDAFAGFQEADLNFPPTYKLLRTAKNADADDDDELKYKGNRRPAWCDRVLFKSDLNVTCETYDSVVCGLSDHYPVVADLVWDW